MGDNVTLDRAVLASVLRAGYEDQAGETWRIIRMSDDGGVVGTPLNDAFVEVLAASYEAAMPAAPDARAATLRVTASAVEHLINFAPPFNRDWRTDADWDPISRSALRAALQKAFALAATADGDLDFGAFLSIPPDEG